MATKSTPKLLVITLPLLVIFFFLGAEYQKNKNQTLADEATDKKINQIRQSSFGNNYYKFIDPLLACSVTSDKDIQEFEPLKEKINSLINSHKYQGGTNEVSVYFDNRNGNWLSINPTEKYSPASLIKVPVGMAFLKIAETDPAILEKKIYYDSGKEENDAEYFKPDKKLTPGTAYTVDELLASMLGSSDNNALYMLLNNIQVALLNEVTTDLGVIIPDGPNDAGLDFLTIKQYVNFFQGPAQLLLFKQGHVGKSFDVDEPNRI